METTDQLIEDITTQEYEYGFVTDIETDTAAVGLSEDTIRFISEKKNESGWMLNWRLKGYNAFLKKEMPTWENFKTPVIDFQGISFYSAPKNKKKYYY